MTSGQLSAQCVVLCLLDATLGAPGRFRPAFAPGRMSTYWRLTAAIAITALQASSSVWVAHSRWLLRGSPHFVVLKPYSGIMTDEPQAGGDSRLGDPEKGWDHVDDPRT